MTTRQARRAFPARCGSYDPAHLARECHDCKRVYSRRFASGESKFATIPRDPATCSFCGLVAGNSQGVKVLRYPLLRHVDRGTKHTSVCIGSMGMCDRCVIENGKINERFLGRAS